jgi:MFS family permease
MASKKSLLALDYFSFCLGDLSAGVGLYLSVYLLSERHWDHASIGIALTALPLAALITQLPAGIIIDYVGKKRWVAAFSFFVLAFCCPAVIIFHQLAAIVVIQSIAGIALSILTSAIVGITMGLVSKDDFSDRVGRNGAFNNLGNVIISICAAILGFYVSQISIFLLLAVIAIMGMIFVLMINESEIDNLRAREISKELLKPISIYQLLSDKRIIVFAIAIGIWQLGNAALCPAAAQYIAESNNKYAGLSMPACILAGQLVMIPMAIFTGKFAHVFGRKPLLLIAFTVLPMRAFLYTLTSNPFAIIAIQLLDGVGAGITIVLTSIIAADLAEGTGRYNFTRSVILFTQGIGMALSNLLAGWLIATHGYNFSFGTLGLVALFALLICQLGVSETQKLAPFRNNIVN